MPDDHGARIKRNEDDIQDIWTKIDSVKDSIEEIKQKLLGRPSWPVMVTMIIAFKIVAVLATYIIMK